MDELKFVGDWSEQDVVHYLATCSEPDFLKLGGISFCHKIIKTLQQCNLLIENAGHDCLPPDYYSENLNIMFDVMRVNDSEKKKGYNPLFQEMSSLIKDASYEIKERGLNNIGTIFTELNSDSSLNYDDIHQFKYYKKHVVRVLTEHIKKLSIWKSEHPNIKRKGFVVLDETGLYFQGCAKPAILKDGHVNKWYFFVKKPLVVHFPWKDEEFIQLLLNADLDFVVWYKPYVTMSDGNLNFFNGKCQDLVVIDVRNKTSLSLQKYDVSDDWFSWQ